MGSVGQYAARLLTVKVGALKKKSAATAIAAKVCARFESVQVQIILKL